jgi:hypothetical protein
MKMWEKKDKYHLKAVTAVTIFESKKGRAVSDPAFLS